MPSAPGAASRPIVHVVEDDESSRRACRRVLESVGHAVRTYETPADFLAASVSEPGCLVLDLRLPGQSGIELQAQLTDRDEALPIVFLTGHGDIPTTVRAMQRGAVDFLTKPVDPQILIDAVARALARDAEMRVTRERRRAARICYDRLTEREREVFAHLLSGQLNKQIGFDLGITERTVKVHRHQVLEKMGAASVADLVRMAADLDIAPIGEVD